MFTSGKKLDPINLNFYRNAHFRKLAYQKKAFLKEIRSLVEGLPVYNKFTVHYTIFAKDKRKFDIANVACILDKYFCDTLVELGKVPDDNYDYLKDIHFTFGGIVGEAYAIVTITPVEEERSMKIVFRQNDIAEAVMFFMNSMMPTVNQQQKDLNFDVQDGEITLTVDTDTFDNTKESLDFENQFTAKNESDPFGSDTENDPEEVKRLELLEEAKSYKIKGIRKDMTIDTLTQKLAEHAEEESKDVHDDSTGAEDSGDSDSEGSDNSSRESDEVTDEDVFGSDEEEPEVVTDEEEEEEGNPFGDSPALETKSKSAEEEANGNSPFDSEDDDDDIFGSE